MFLKVMNQEEKEKFLELIYKVANIDGEYAEEEEEIIDNYKIELGIKNMEETASLEELVDYFGIKNSSLKKIVFFETVGLVNADDKFEKAEEEVLLLMHKKFGFDDREYEKIINIAKKLQSVYDEVFELIFG